MGELHIAPLPNSNSTYFVYKQTDETNAKECPICLCNCTSYLHCDNSEKHFVCKDCCKKMLEVKYKEMFENTAFVNPDASIDKWKCPTCRHQNELEVVKIARARQIRDTPIEDALAREQETNEVSRQVIENRLSRIDENAPSKFRWVLSLDWKNSIVNHFKAWIMYTTSSYVENINHRPPSGPELTVLKRQHHYEERKRSPQAPWFNFLERTTPP